MIALYIEKIMQSIIFKRILGFSFVGVFVTIFSMTLTFIFNELCHINVYVTYVLSFSISIFVSYILNTYFVFKSHFTLKTLFLYYLIYAFSMLLGLIILRIYSMIFQTWNRTIISYMVIPFTMSFNFFFVSKMMKKIIKH